MLVLAYYLAQMCQECFLYNGNFKTCIAIISLLFVGKYGNLNKLSKFQIMRFLKKVGLYLQNGSYLISNSPYTIKLVRKSRLLSSDGMVLYAA